jgi:hypothetical protein
MPEHPPIVTLPFPESEIDGETVEFTPTRDGITIPVIGTLEVHRDGLGISVCASYCLTENPPKRVVYWFDQREIDALKLRP